MLSFPEERRVCCLGYLTAPDVAREILDSYITEFYLEDLVTVLCSHHDSIDLQHIVQNVVYLSTKK